MTTIQDTTTEAVPIDAAALESFIGRFVDDMGAVLHACTVVLGDRLGLYAAMADGRPITPAELSWRTGVIERYLLEWLSAQAAAGYVVHDPDTGTFTLPPEHAATLVDGRGPVFVPGALQLAGGLFKDVDGLVDAYRSGTGFGWHQHHHDLFVGTERFFRPGYAANLVASWLPALDGVVDRLTAGGRVADVGCGLGASTILMAQAFPASTFVGSDYHRESIELARRAADDAGVAGRVSFEVAPAQSFDGSRYDLVTFFDCLHDMGDPVGAARRVREALTEDGVWMIVEPMAGEQLADNLNPVGKVFYAASTLVCTPASKAQDVALCLGAQASESRLAAIVADAGFTRFRRATETPFNRVYEARP